MTSKIINFVFFNLAWLGVVASASHGWSFVAPFIVIGWIIPFLIWEGNLKSEIGLLTAAAVLGVFCDTILFWTGAIELHGSTHTLFSISPVWMIALWVNLAASLRYCLHWLLGRYWLSSVIGGIAGSLAYTAGQGLGALQLPVGPVPVVIEWVLAMPLLLLIERWTRKRLAKNHSHTVDVAS